ncbi:MAG: CPXCG motif-containing cysteine-rich protein [Methylosarcina sp.]
MRECEEMVIDCPYCGEPLDVLVDTSSGPQHYYEDCAVCCSPILFILSEDDSGELYLDVKRDDE